MSRTRHQLPTRCHTRPLVQNRRKAEQSALGDVVYYDIPCRHFNRLQAFMTVIPEPWNDKICAAWGEYHNKNHYK